MDKTSWGSLGTGLGHTHRSSSTVPLLGWPPHFPELFFSSLLNSKREQASNLSSSGGPLCICILLHSSSDKEK